MAASSPFTPAPAPPLPPSGLVGREREQQRLGALLAAAANGQGRLVLIGGEAGIGKTALVRALAAEAAAHGADRPERRLLRSRAPPRPMAPGASCWRRLPSDDGLPPLPAALIDVGDPEPGGEAALFRQVLDLLTASPRQPRGRRAGGSALGRPGQSRSASLPRPAVWPPSRCCWSPPTGPTR